MGSHYDFSRSKDSFPVPVSWSFDEVLYLPPTPLKYTNPGFLSGSLRPPLSPLLHQWRKSSTTYFRRTTFTILYRYGPTVEGLEDGGSPERKSEGQDHILIGGHGRNSGDRTLSGFQDLVRREFSDPEFYQDSHCLHVPKESPVRLLRTKRRFLGTGDDKSGEVGGPEELGDEQRCMRQSEFLREHLGVRKPCPPVVDTGLGVEKGPVRGRSVEVGTKTRRRRFPPSTCCLLQDSIPSLITTFNTTVFLHSSDSY